MVLHGLAIEGNCDDEMVLRVDVENLFPFEEIHFCVVMLVRRQEIYLMTLGIDFRDFMGVKRGVGRVGWTGWRGG